MGETASSRSRSVHCRAVSGYEDAAAADAAVESIFAACACTRQLGAQSHVLLKPNLLSRHVPAHAVTTHPAVVRAAVRACIARGVLPANITVADSSGGVYNPGVMKSTYAMCGMTAVCEETGAQLYTACESAPRKTDGVLVHEFNLIAPVHAADFIIDLPKAKTHVMTGISGAVKNLFGTVPGLQKAEFHMRFPDKERFGAMLANLYACVAPQLCIVDGIMGMEGDGPAGGSPRALGVLLGGEDAYTIDLALCRMMGADAEAVPYLRAGMERGACPRTLDLALLCGDAAAAAPVPDFRLPASAHDINFVNRTPRAIRWAVPGMENLIAPHPKVEPKKCIGCGRCAEICPAHTITLRGGKAHINSRNCIRCFCCHEMCPAKAIAVKRFGAFRL